MRTFSNALKWQSTSPNLAKNAEFNLGNYPFPTSNMVRKLHALAPDEIPSGIPGLELSAKDHILFFVASTTNRYFDFVADFVAAGLEDPVFSEICTLEMSNKWTEQAGRQALRARTDKLSGDRLDILSWEVGVSPYGLEKPEFQRETMQNAFIDPMYKARTGFHPGEDKCVRIASEDSSYFLLNLQNPRAYLAYERDLPNDLFSAFKSPVLQFCSYELSDLKSIEKESAITIRESIVSLLDAHNKVVALTEEDNLLVGSRAVQYALSLISMERASLGTWLKYLYVRIKHSAF